MAIPKVFISYSHDTLEHKKWVLELATRLRNNGIDAILDQFELKPGDDVPHFMETHLSTSSKILMVCTEKYVEKANKGQGGVGYEKMIVTSNLMKNIDENKIIPIIRQSGSTEVPTFLKSKLYINFSKKDEYEYSYDDLVRSIHNTPLFEKPSVGNNPFVPVVKENLEGDIKILNSLLTVIIQKQGSAEFIASDKVILGMGISPVLFKLSMFKLIELGYADWHGGRSWVCSTDKGMMYAFDNKLVT